MCFLAFSALKVCFQVVQKPHETSRISLRVISFVIFFTRSRFDHASPRLLQFAVSIKTLHAGFLLQYIVHFNLYFEFWYKNVNKLNSQAVFLDHEIDSLKFSA